MDDITLFDKLLFLNDWLLSIDDNIKRITGLIKKYPDEEYYLKQLQENNKKSAFFEAIKEDLLEYYKGQIELGCHLSIVIDAIKNGIIDEKGKEIYHVRLIIDNEGKFALEDSKYSRPDWCLLYYLDDYEKTWYLLKGEQ